MQWFSTASTFLKNFSIPCLYVALAAAAVAGSAGVYAGRRWDAAQVAEAKAETLEARIALTNYQMTVASTTSKALTIGFARQTAAADAVNALHIDIVNAIAAGYVEVGKAVKANTNAFRSATNASEFKCLDLPLSESALGVYRRPGGSAGTADH